MRRVTSVETPLAHLVGPGKLKVVNGQLAYSTGEGTPLRLDPQALRAVYCYGAVSISDEALRLVLEHDVQLAFLSAQGMRCRGRLVRDDSSKTTLRLLQHGAFANPAAQRDWAARVVEAKIES